MPKIIQFLHPGGEHSEKSGQVWNAHPPHKRKFVSWNGEYVEKIDNITKKGNIDFWCEWEVESHLLAKKKVNNYFPKNLFQPYYTHYKKGAGCENTDPFVFGKKFYYSICRQPKNETLRNLEKNTLILFGSNKGASFVLDTVFIVKNSTPYSKKDFEKLRSTTNPAFFETAILPVVYNSNDKVNDNRCTDGKEIYSVYEGISVKDDPAFFSYVPCKVHSENWGFERPILNYGGIGQSIKQNIKFIKLNNKVEHSEKEIKDFWKDITNIILKKKLSLMTSCDLPKQT